MRKTPGQIGMEKEVLNYLCKTKIRQIAYLSCNPATQARDLQELDIAYKVQEVQPVDMFPHTPHVENVVQLLKR